MHMHGSYFRVDSAGNSETDRVLAPEQQLTVATNRLLTNGTMTTYWIPPPGHWLFPTATLFPMCLPRDDRRQRSGR